MAVAAAVVVVEQRRQDEGEGLVESSRKRGHDKTRTREWVG